MLNISTGRLLRTAATYGAAFGVVITLTAWDANAQRMDQTVASDGAELVVRSSGKTFEASNRGAGRVLAPGEVDDSSADIKARGETAAEFARLLATKAMGAPVGTETIIGPDSRILVNPTTTYPARATVLITFNTPSGASRCTGFMIGRDTVLTAGHCVAQAGSGRFYNRATFRMYAGRNGGSAPYGTCLATRLFTVNGWLNSGSELFDIGAIKLNCNVGNTVGWYGYFWQSATLVGRPMATRGYPGDKPLTQWSSQDAIRANSGSQIFYRADTVGGQSGSPVYFNRSASCNPCAMGVHAYGLHGAGVHATNNHGTRISQALFNTITNWRNAPK